MEENNYSQARTMIKKSEAILISASNGLSISEGYRIFASDETFFKRFGDIADRYGFNSIIQGIFTLMNNEDKADYMNRLHHYLIDEYKPSESYQLLLNLVKDKDYFILTSNGDKHFKLSGFSENRIFEAEGDFFNEADTEYQERNYIRFMNRVVAKNVLQLELGIGKNNKILKAPLMKTVEENPSWHYLSMNLNQEIYVLPSIQNRSLTIKGDIRENLKKIMEAK